MAAMMTMKTLFDRCLRRMSRRLRSESGAELIEFALIFPTLLLVVGGIADLGFLFQRYEVITNAAREGARVAVLPGYADADVIARVNSYMTAAGLTGTSSVTVNPPQAITAGANCMNVRPVTVTYNSDLYFLGPIFGLMGGGTTKQIRATASMRMELAATPCP